MTTNISNGRVWIDPKDIHVALNGNRLKPGEMGHLWRSKVPGVQWHGGKKLWWIPASLDNVTTINNVLKIKLSAPEMGNEITTFKYKTLPRKHQFGALQACSLREAFAYFMDPGLGKTKVAIDDMQILNHKKEVTHVIITCPKSIIATWLREIRTHGHYEQWRVVVWNNDKSKPFVETVHEPENGGVTMKWFVIGIDSLLPDSMGWRAAYAFVMNSGACGIIVDESTTIKNIESKRTTQVMILGDNCKYRRILTGTPIGNTPLDFYAQLMFLDSAIFYGWSYYAFKSHYAITGGYKQREIYGYTNQDELATIVGQHSFRATKEECLDLPPRIWETRDISISPKTWRLYGNIIDETFAELEGEKQITVDMVTKKLTKLRQLTGGWILGDVDNNRRPGSDREIIQVGTEKLDDLCALMDECGGHQVIVWCEFVHEVHALYEKMKSKGLRTARYYGALKTGERTSVEETFESGRLDTIIIQNQTGSMGLTLNAAKYAIAYSLPQYLLTRTQLTERNYRDGQTKSVTFWDMLCTGTIDELLHNSLASGKNLSDAIMSASATKDLSQLKEVLYPKKLRGSWKNIPIN